MEWFGGRDFAPQLPKTWLEITFYWYSFSEQLRVRLFY